MQDDVKEYKLFLLHSFSRCFVVFKCIGVAVKTYFSFIDANVRNQGSHIFPFCVSMKFGFNSILGILWVASILGIEVYIIIRLCSYRTV